MAVASSATPVVASARPRTRAVMSWRTRIMRRRTSAIALTSGLLSGLDRVEKWETAAMAVAAIELVRHEPDWPAALARALSRPAGLPERRSRPETPANDAGAPRRRIADELAWLREVIDEPGAHSFELASAAAQLWWQTGEGVALVDLERLANHRDSGSYISARRLV